MQAMLAEAVQSHASAPTLQEEQSAAALVSHHSLRQLKQWTAPGQQILDRLAASSLETASQVGPNNAAYAPHQLEHATQHRVLHSPLWCACQAACNDTTLHG